jgi:hypothetical protein
LPKKASLTMRPVKPIMAMRPRVTSSCAGGGTGGKEGDARAASRVSMSPWGSTRL